MAYAALVLLELLIQFDRTREPGRAWITPVLFERLGGRGNDPIDTKTAIAEAFRASRGLKDE